MFIISAMIKQPVHNFIVLFNLLPVVPSLLVFGPHSNTYISRLEFLPVEFETLPVWIFYHDIYTSQWYVLNFTRK